MNRRSESRTQGRMGAIALFILFSLAIALWASLSSLAGRSLNSEVDLLAKKFVTQALGVASLAITYECTSTRTLIEGICGCLGDVPGGYCYHSSCDIIAPPSLTEIERVRRLLRQAQGGER